MIGLLISLIVGGIVGALAQNVMKKNVPGGIIGNIIIGFLGSSLGGFLLGDFGPAISGFAIIPAIIGAILIVVIYDLIF
ncbi:MAG TPA: GlsB/YeaQ/YmgE family stress response membrane protein [Alloiococcus sp.]|nr:GlsB/YeaQ/YmgE family stress response membrane protein [Alloiococcus sp.]